MHVLEPRRERRRPVMRQLGLVVTKESELVGRSRVTRGLVLVVRSELTPPVWREEDTVEKWENWQVKYFTTSYWSSQFQLGTQYSILRKHF